MKKQRITTLIGLGLFALTALTMVAVRVAKNPGITQAMEPPSTHKCLGGQCSLKLGTP
jgi:hypothetical protein